MTDKHPAVRNTDWMEIESIPERNSFRERILPESGTISS